MGVSPPGGAMDRGRVGGGATAEDIARESAVARRAERQRLAAPPATVRGMSSEWRYYRSPRVRWVSGIGLSALIIGIGGLTAGYAAGKDLSIVLVLVFAVGVVGLAVNFVRFVSRAGVKESRQGLAS